MDRVPLNYKPQPMSLMLMKIVRRMLTTLELITIIHQKADSQNGKRATQNCYKSEFRESSKSSYLTLAGATPILASFVSAEMPPPLKLLSFAIGPTSTSPTIPSFEHARTFKSTPSLKRLPIPGTNPRSCQQDRTVWQSMQSNGDMAVTGVRTEVVRALTMAR